MVDSEEVKFKTCFIIFSFVAFYVSAPDWLQEDNPLDNFVIIRRSAWKLHSFNDNFFLRNIVLYLDLENLTDLKFPNSKFNSLWPSDLNQCQSVPKTIELTGHLG